MIFIWKKRELLWIVLLSVCCKPNHHCVIATTPSLPSGQQVCFLTTKSSLRSTTHSCSSKRWLLPFQNKNNMDAVMKNMEKEVKASAQTTVDMNQIKNALSIRSSKEKSSVMVPKTTSTEPPSQLSISIAAGITSSVVSYIVFSQFYVSAFCFGLVLFVANFDLFFLPDDKKDVVGPIARMVGRATISSVETIQPKVKAMTFAAITNEEELKQIQLRLSELENENVLLKKYIQQRNLADEISSNYTVKELKTIAKTNKITISSSMTKVQILMSLLQADCLNTAIKK